MSKRWWFRGVCVGLAALVIGVSAGLFVRFHVPVEGEGFVSVSLGSVVLAAPGWESPTSDVANGWTDSGNAWDESTASYALYDVPGASWSPFLELHIAEIQCDKVQVFIGLEKDGTNIDSMELDVYYSGSYNNIYTGVVTIDTWQEYAIGSEQAVTAMQVRFYNNHNAQPREVYFYEADFWEVSAAAPDISNVPASIGFGQVDENTDYWSSGSAPTFPLDDGECYFTVTNNSGAAADITVEADDFTGGDGWTLTSSAPGSGTVRVRAGKSGDANEAAMVVLTTSPQSFMTGLADTASKKWEVKLETGTFTDGVLKESTVTLTASLS